ncbi:hypothetical protein FAGAP_2133 [Fusarium agapanthi]|uniref:Uncharacterized protein n=1 Tax=Fusarium agapanthi TaxID=1803897 RepID=A0A9P5BHR1_9HYPO|nr:hypothetical protein FAGAP_2133 [Fusarium agapanthi]
MNRYHLVALARRIDSSPLGLDTLRSVMRNPYLNLLVTTDLGQRYHPLPRTLYEPQDVLEGYWTVTATLQSTAWLQITIRPALYDDPPSHAWHDLRDYHQIRAGVTLRIARRNAMMDMRYLRQIVFPFAEHARRRTTPLLPIQIHCRVGSYQRPSSVSDIAKTVDGNRDVRRTEEFQRTRRSDGLQDIL